MSKRVGRIRWFNAQKGYGFVLEDGQEDDIFLHYSAIQSPGYKVLEQGQRVVFWLEATDKGPVAHDVVPIEED
ncbi:MAG: cold-shock protein [Deltaproteobacteria bacterium CG2_30_63_29]|nr:MAG: cold-shock protein [Deltaproteobacteria bacterium CG2_30_63_29]PJB41086.1 MAG: cold-shock protein [Deltaproteobacteria bacterium CG_4_9_14_3_um_filter_63_12]